MHYYTNDVFLLWNQGAVVNVARRMAETLDWDLLPILADALEEAGYAYGDDLLHLRDYRNVCEFYRDPQYEKKKPCIIVSRILAAAEALGR